GCAANLPWLNTDDAGRRGGEAPGLSSVPKAPASRAYWATRSSALYMYLTLCLRTRRFGADLRFTLRALRSYHSIVPSISSPSCSTIIIGVCASICFL